MTSWSSECVCLVYCVCSVGIIYRQHLLIPWHIRIYIYYICYMVYVCDKQPLYRTTICFSCDPHLPSTAESPESVYRLLEFYEPNHKICKYHNNNSSSGKCVFVLDQCISYMPGQQCLIESFGNYRVYARHYTPIALQLVSVLF